MHIGQVTEVLYYVNDHMAPKKHMITLCLLCAEDTISASRNVYLVIGDEDHAALEELEILSRFSGCSTKRKITVNDNNARM